MSACLSFRLSRGLLQHLLSVSLPYFHEDLKAAWEKRDADHKFKIVCYVHHVVDMDWKRWLPWWSRRDSIRLVAISEQ